MNSPEEAARAYLEEAISRAAPSLTMADVSRHVGKNHAYIQQYIRTGKPRWLPERVREAVVSLLNIDGERLKPPPVLIKPPPVLIKPRLGDQPGRNGHDQPQINAPRYGQFVDDPSTLELLEIWGKITDPGTRDLGKRILRTMAERISAIII